jgi:CHAT domain-containing protein
MKRKRWGQWGRRSLGAFVLFFLLGILLGITVPIATAQQPHGQPRSIAQVQTDARSIVDRAREAYRLGDYGTAVQLWQQLAREFEEGGDRLNAAMAWSNLALSDRQLGRWEDARTAIARSFSLLETTEKSGDRDRVWAQAADIRGELYRGMGDLENAIASWQEAAKLYQLSGQKNRLLNNQLNRAETLQDLGLYPRACNAFLTALEIEDRDCDLSDSQFEQFVNHLWDDRELSALKLRGAIGLGNLFRLRGNLTDSATILSKTAQLSAQIDDRTLQAIAYLSLGNTQRFLDEKEAAFASYARSAQLATSEFSQLQARLNQLSLTIALKSESEATDLARELENQIGIVPLTQQGIYAEINFAKSLIQLATKIQGSQESPDRSAERSWENFDRAERILQGAIDRARQLGNARAQAYALGTLGKLYEARQDWDRAIQFSLEALQFAPSYTAPDIAYQFLWQLGRLESHTGDLDAAIAHYGEAVKTLQALRSDLVAIGDEAQFSFRESVEPIYREFAALLLRRDRQVSQADLIQAREVVESLQLAELDNFFQDACLDTQPVQIDRVDEKAAAIYTIILSDRLETIVSIPGKPLKHYTAEVDRPTVEAEIEAMRLYLTDPRRRSAIDRFQQISQQIYDWIVGPASVDLENHAIETLVFVLDGGFRNLPMSALYDGEGYLIEKYAIALTPGLQLLEPKPLQSQTLSVLTAGISEARQGFVELPGVESELDRIANKLPTKRLLNPSFTEANFKTTLDRSSFPVVHIASHGQFSSDADQTFILTWDDRIDVREFDTLLRRNAQGAEPIELLVLSACQTASGDKRAALGLAGVAVRAGARSTIASLWYVSDRATAQLMTEFYRQLSDRPQSKAQALRGAQQALLQNEEFSTPYFWSAFVLVGNWL